MDTSNVLNLREFEPLARASLSQSVFEYYAGGANDDVTLRENEAAFQRILLRPRMMTGMADRSMATTLLGQPMNAPILIAPMAFMLMAHAEGEAGMARAAASRGIHMVVSTSATTSLEDVDAAAPTGSRWFQLYLYQDRGAALELVQRAEAAHYQALVLTVDRPILGRREADIRNNFGLPAHLQMQNLPSTVSRSGSAGYHSTMFEANLQWSDLRWLKSNTRLPVLVKGVLRGDDARLALEHGADGVIVSNHGGRQLDSALAAIDALPDVAQAVDGRAPVLVDGGIRRGTDIIKALALGAQAVLLGRPALWALVLDGEAGVCRALDLLIEEFDLALALCGCRSLKDVTPDLLASRPNIQRA